MDMLVKVHEKLRKSMSFAFVCELIYINSHTNAKLMDFHSVPKVATSFTLADFRMISVLSHFLLCHLGFLSKYLPPVSPLPLLCLLADQQVFGSSGFTSAAVVQLLHTVTIPPKVRAFFACFCAYFFENF